MAHIKDPLALAMNFMPWNWHFILKDPPKSIKFYSNILKQEQFALVENIRDKKDPPIVLYHKLFIKKFISYKEWGQHPSILRTLEGMVPQYSYYDYVDAFEKVSYFQNGTFDHSWFLMFDKNFDSQIHTWFLKWWEMFRSVPQILPPALQDTLRYFSSVFTMDNYTSQFPAILHMTA